ncbi:MAG: hypothetical protein VB092_07380 [Oscillospiraceae bacterium]|nr:hypothetical protein [Oscillospiraceae bacterium]
MEEEKIEFPTERFGVKEKYYPVDLPEDHKCRLCVWRIKQSSKLFCPFAVCVKDNLPDRKEE